MAVIIEAAKAATAEAGAVHPVQGADHDHSCGQDGPGTAACDEIHDGAPTGLEGLSAADPTRLLQALEASDRFERDSAIGRIFHPGKISFREKCPADSLHVIIDGTRVSAHVDSYSPLRFKADGRPTYAWGSVILHNVAGFSADLGRLLRGRQGEQRCNLDCEIVWVDDEAPKR